MVLPRRAESAIRELGKYEVVVFDCDGVLWIHDAAVAGAVEAVDCLRRRGKKVYFNTNLSATTREDYVTKFAKLGFRGVRKSEIQTSAHSAAMMLIDRGYRGKKVYVIGEPGLAKELEASGMVTVGTTPSGHTHAYTDPNVRAVKHKEMAAVPIDPDVKAVVVGMDWHINYFKIAYASLCIQNGAEFFATNADRSSPMTSGQHLPATGCMVGAVAMTCGRNPTLIAGKPNPFALDRLLQELGVDRSRVLMVGDRLDTDIQFGKEAGVDTMLVLSGVTSEQEAMSAPDALRPTWVAESVDVFRRIPARL